MECHVQVQDKENYGENSAVLMNDQNLLSDAQHCAHHAAMTPLAIPMPPLSPNGSGTSTSSSTDGYSNVMGGSESYNDCGLAWKTNDHHLGARFDGACQRQRHDHESDFNSHSPPKMTMNNNFLSANNSNSGNAGIRRPVTLRPSSMLDPPNPPGVQSEPLLLLRPPSSSELSHQRRPPPFISGLGMALNEEGGEMNTRQELSRGSVPGRREPNNVPQLHMRPITKKELKMPSPLARRGAAERAYLQGQLKAEAQRRRKQEEHNERRKLRENFDVPSIETEADDEKMADGDIQTMIDKFKFGFGDMGHPAGNTHNKLKFLPKKKNSRTDLRDFGAASPPAILMKTFKRSVSEVLEDSGIMEDGNLLFFPGGEPLLEDLDESPYPVIEFADVKGISDSESQDIAHEEGSACGSASQESSNSDDDDLSPSLIAADVIWQLGGFACDDVPGLAMPTNKGNKKVTLRPKMNAPKNDITSSPHPTMHSTPINGPKSSVSFSSESDIQSGQSNAAPTPDEKVPPPPPFKFETPDKFYNAKGANLGFSESFQQLLFDNEDGSENQDEAGCYTQHEGSNFIKPSFSFSSPDPGFNYHTPDSSFNDRRSRKSFMGMASRMLDQAIEDDNANGTSFKGGQMYSYCTPDYTEHKRSSRKYSSERMPRLPELGMPEVGLNLNFGVESIEASVEEKNVATEGLQAGLLLKEPLSESKYNYETPDSSFQERHAISKQLGEELIPRFPVLGLRLTNNEGSNGKHQHQAQQARFRPMETGNLPLSESQENLFTPPIKTPC